MFVTSIDLSRAEQLRQDLTAQGFTFTTPPYTLFAAQKVGISCTLYTSGKLVVQGKGMKDFIEFYLEPEFLKNLAFTQAHTLVDKTPHIGVDEAGKGDLFGPLCIAGVYADTMQIEQLCALGVKDSKTLSDVTITRLAGEIRKICTYDTIAISPERYNQLYEQFRNLNKLLAWGHSKVIENLFQQTGCTYVIIDRFAAEWVVNRALAQKKISLNLHQRTKGEQDVVVAAASILARATFVDRMQQLSDSYAIHIPKGASPQALAAAQQLLNIHGPAVLSKLCKTHFRPIQKLLGIDLSTEGEN